MNTCTLSADGPPSLGVGVSHWLARGNYKVAIVSDCILTQVIDRGRATDFSASTLVRVEGRH